MFEFLKSILRAGLKQWHFIKFSASIRNHILEFIKREHSKLNVGHVIFPRWKNTRLFTINEKRRRALISNAVKDNANALISHFYSHFATCIKRPLSLQYFPAKKIQKDARN